MICFGIYIAVSIVSIRLFGNTVSSSVLINIGEIRTADGKPWESTVIQISFMIVLMCHIPFMFFAGKEAACIIADELHRKSISRVLSLKMQINEVEDEQDTRVSIN